MPYIRTPVLFCFCFGSDHTGAVLALQTLLFCCCFFVAVRAIYSTRTRPRLPKILAFRQPLSYSRDSKIKSTASSAISTTRAQPCRPRISREQRENGERCINGNYEASSDISAAAVTRPCPPQIKTSSVGSKPTSSRGKSEQRYFEHHCHTAVY